MPFVIQGKTNWKYILIVLILAVIVGGGILWWVKYQQIEFLLIKSPQKIEKKVTITTDKTEYEIGENIKVTIKNNLGRSIWYKWYDPILDLWGYNEKTNWIRIPLTHQTLPTPPLQEVYPEIKKDEALTFEYNPLRFIDKNSLNFVKYKLGFEYRESKKEGEYKKIYSNEFIIKEKISVDETANWKTYRNEEYGFEIKYPETWTYVMGANSYCPGVSSKKRCYDIHFSKKNDPANSVLDIFNPKGYREITGYTRLNIENMEFANSKQMRIGNTDFFLKENFYVPKKGMGKENVVLVQWIAGNLENSGEMIMFYKDENDENFIYFNYMLSTFRFIEEIKIGEVEIDYEEMKRI